MQATHKGSVQASDSERSSEGDTESQASDNSDDEVGGDSDSENEGSGSGGDGSGNDNEGSGGDFEGPGGKGKAEDDGSQQGDSSSEIAKISCHKAEESGSESSSSSSESNVDTKKIRPDKKSVKPNPKTTLPKLVSKDSEEECMTKCQGFVCCSDTNFSMWQDEQISQGLRQWDERDKMSCDHMEPGKEAKCPDPLGAPLDYMESHRVFKKDKMSKYNLCHFYQVGLSGDFPKFPAPCEPSTNDHLHHFLENARECSQPNLLVVHSWDAVTAVCLLKELHAKASLWCLKMETDAKAGDKLKRQLSFCPLCQYLGSNDLPYLNDIVCVHYNVSYGCGKCVKEVFPSRQ